MLDAILHLFHFYFDSSNQTLSNRKHYSIMLRLQLLTEFSYLEKNSEFLDMEKRENVWQLMNWMGASPKEMSFFPFLMYVYFVVNVGVVDKSK